MQIKFPHGTNTDYYVMYINLPRDVNFISSFAAFFCMSKKNVGALHLKN